MITLAINIQELSDGRTMVDFQGSGEGSPAEIEMAEHIRDLVGGLMTRIAQQPNVEPVIFLQRDRPTAPPQQEGN
jgi:hypothetical protein